MHNNQYASFAFWTQPQYFIYKHAWAWTQQFIWQNSRKKTHIHETIKLAEHHLLYPDLDHHFRLMFNNSFLLNSRPCRFLRENGWNLNIKCVKWCWKRYTLISNWMHYQISQNILYNNTEICITLWITGILMDFMRACDHFSSKTNGNKTSWQWQRIPGNNFWNAHETFMDWSIKLGHDVLMDLSTFWNTRCFNLNFYPTAIVCRAFVWRIACVLVFDLNLEKGAWGVLDWQITHQGWTREPG